MEAKGETGSDEFSGRLGLIFATIGAAIGTGIFGVSLEW